MTRAEINHRCDTSEKGRERARRYSMKRYYDRKYDLLCAHCGSPYLVTETRCGDCAINQALRYDSCRIRVSSNVTHGIVTRLDT